jgi:hypothetical protein
MMMTMMVYIHASTSTSKKRKKGEKNNTIYNESVVIAIVIASLPIKKKSA